MGATLDALLKLQEIEKQLVEYRRGIESRRRQIRGATRRMQKALQEHQETLARIRDKQTHADALDLEIKSRDTQTARLREALNRAKSNREYAAILTQINTAKADTTKQEEQALHILSEIEAVREQAKVQLEQAEKEKKRLADLEDAFAEHRAAVQVKIDDLQARRDQALEDLPPEIVNIFERVSARHEGEVLAAVIQENPRRQEFSCGGCSMAVTLEQFNRLHDPTEIVTCNICGRILFLPG
jgi:predicted  nucleic acid-binding Zn-ribbon protein